MEGLQVWKAYRGVGLTGVGVRDQGSGLSIWGWAEWGGLQGCNVHGLGLSIWDRAVGFAPRAEGGAYRGVRLTNSGSGSHTYLPPLFRVLGVGCSLGSASPFGLGLTYPRYGGGRGLGFRVQGSGFRA